MSIYARSGLLGLLLVFGYFAFTPILNLTASYGVPSWGGFIIFVIVCWCVLMLLSADVIFERFSDAAFNIVFSGSEYHEGGAKPSPSSSHRMEDFIKVGKQEPEETDDFAFDPSAFSNEGSDEVHDREQKAAELSVLLGGEVSQPTENDAADSGETEHHPDDLALWEVVNDPSSTAEERKTALSMILDRETDRKSHS